MMENNNWPIKSLSELCDSITYGYTESASIEKIGPKFLRITDIASGRLNWDFVPYCKISDSDFEKYKLKAGDIVIARTGATTGANYTFKQNDPENVVYASYLIKYSIDDEIAYPYFIGYVLKSNNWSEYVDAIAGGSAQPGANAKQLGSFEIQLPPLSEQKAIASVLSSLDDKIDLLHQQNQTLEALAETLFRQWFIEEVKEDWEEKKLDEVSLIKAGGDKPKKCSHVKTEELSIPIYSNGISNKGLYGYTDQAKIFDECITISARGTIGFVCLRKTPFVPIVRLISIVPDNKCITTIYLYLWAKSQNIFGTGSTQEQLTVPDISDSNIIIPPKFKLDKFSEIADAYFNKIDLNEFQIQTLSQLRDTLLPKLMSGEVRVKN